jgi:hypothetical protein
MLSVNIAALGAIASGAWIITPHDQQLAILSYAGISEGAVPMVLFLAVIFGRLLQQPSIDNGTTAPEHDSPADHADAQEPPRLP